MTLASQMHVLTQDVAPYVLYYCSCSRRFISDELYLCFKCSEVKCRFCTDEEIISFYCRHCMDNFSQVEAAPTRNLCTRFLQCPICFQVLKFGKTPPTSQTQRERLYYYYCVFCAWNTLQCGMKTRVLQTRVHMFGMYRWKFVLSP